jgi:hypothetical protein
MLSWTDALVYGEQGEADRRSAPDLQGSPLAGAAGAALVLPSWKKLPRALLNQTQSRRLVSSPDPFYTHVAPEDLRRSVEKAHPRERRWRRRR